MKIPDKAKKLLEKRVVFFGTCNDLLPNITATESGVVVDPEKFLLSDCQMTLAKENILKNPNCCIITYDYQKKLDIRDSEKLLTMTQENF
jgi:hypothetical protein